jgi:hypothetical protein
MTSPGIFVEALSDVWPILRRAGRIKSHLMLEAPHVVIADFPISTEGAS